LRSVCAVAAHTLHVHSRSELVTAAGRMRLRRAQVCRRSVCVSEQVCQSPSLGCQRVTRPACVRLRRVQSARACGTPPQPTTSCAWHAQCSCQQRCVAAVCMRCAVACRQRRGLGRLA
jgi:hypothetical protein